MNNLLENASNYILENNKNVPSISEILNEALELLYEDKIPSVLLQAYKKAAGNPFNKNLENPVRISGHLDLLQKYSAFHQDTDRKTYAFDFGKATYEFKSKLEAINDLGLTNSILLDKRPINNINDILSLRQFSFKAGAGRTNIISINKNAINGDSLKENISKYRFIYSDSGLNEIHYNADTDAFFIAARCNIPANAFNDKQVEQDAIVTQGRLEFIISGEGKPGNISDGAKAALIAILFSETIIKTDDNEHPLMSKTFNIHSLKNQKQKALDTLTQNVDLKSFPVSMSTILNAFNYIIKTQIYSSTLKLILDSGKLNTLSRDDAIWAKNYINSELNTLDTVKLSDTPECIAKLALEVWYKTELKKNPKEEYSIYPVIKHIINDDHFKKRNYPNEILYQFFTENYNAFADQSNLYKRLTNRSDVAIFNNALNLLADKIYPEEQDARRKEIYIKRNKLLNQNVRMLLMDLTDDEVKKHPGATWNTPKDLNDPDAITIPTMDSETLTFNKSTHKIMLDKSEVDTGSHDYHKTKPFGDTPALRSFYMLIQHKKDKRKILTNYQKALNIHKKFRKESNNGFEYLSGYTEQEWASEYNQLLDTYKAAKNDYSKFCQTLEKIYDKLIVHYCDSTRKIHDKLQKHFNLLETWLTWLFNLKNYIKSIDLYDLSKLKEIFGKNSNSSQEIDDLTNIIKNLVAASKEVEERLKVVKKEKEELLKQLEALEKVEVELEVDQQELLSNLDKYDNTAEEVNTDIDENEQIFNTFYETKNSLFELKTSLEKEYNNYLQTWRRSGNNSKKPSEERPEILDSFDFKEFLDKITVPENLLKLINKYRKEEINTNSNNIENDVFDEVDLEQLIQEVDEEDIDDFDFDDLD